MNFYKFLLPALQFFLAVAACAQERLSKRPFSISAGGITVTGTYSEGYMYKHTVNGTNILWGLISWGGEEKIECRPGNSICVLTMSVGLSLKGVCTNRAGLKSFDIAGIPDNGYPVVISKDGNTIQFAVDVEKVPSGKRSVYQSNTWRLESPFILTPQAVKELGLYSGSEPMGFIIPAGDYPLYRDGNISYWTWTIPQ